MKRLLSIRQVALAVAALTGLGLALTASAAQERPFKGHADVVTIGVEEVPGGLLLTGSATGKATHLGRFTRTETLLLNPITGTFAGTIEFTAANGDQLYADVAGGFISPTTAVGTYTFTGGTGRFEDASGGAAFTAVTADGTNFDVTFKGTIQF